MMSAGGITFVTCETTRVTYLSGYWDFPSCFEDVKFLDTVGRRTSLEVNLYQRVSLFTCGNNIMDSK